VCKYCERRKDVPFGWNQPALENVNGNIIDSESEVNVYDYQTRMPELVIKLPTLAEILWGSGFGTIYIPIYFCPVCGRKLGRPD
jgi:hypothetical protein